MNHCGRVVVSKYRAHFLAGILAVLGSGCGRNVSPIAQPAGQNPIRVNGVASGSLGESAPSSSSILTSAATPTVQPTLPDLANHPPKGLPQLGDLVALSRETLSPLETYQCTQLVFGRKDGENVSFTLNQTWQAPGLLRLEVKETNLSDTLGSVLVHHGGQTIKLFNPALPFFMRSMTLSATDSRITDGFGNHFHLATWPAVLANLTETDSRVRKIGSAVVEGEPTVAFEVSSPRLAKAGLQKEQIGLHRLDGKPIFIQQIDQAGVATQIVFKDYRYNAVPDPSIFNL